MKTLREAQGKHRNLGFKTVVPYQTCTFTSQQVVEIEMAIRDGWFEIISDDSKEILDGVDSPGVSDAVALSQEVSDESANNTAGDE